MACEAALKCAHPECEFAALSKAGLTSKQTTKHHQSQLAQCAHCHRTFYHQGLLNHQLFCVLRDLATAPTPQPTSTWTVPLPCSTRTMECKQRGRIDGVCVRACVSIEYGCSFSWLSLYHLCYFSFSLLNYVQLFKVGFKLEEMEIQCLYKFPQLRYLLYISQTPLSHDQP